METTSFSKIRTLENDPQYFGGFLNMARLNVFNINNFLASEFNKTVLPDDDFLKNSFLCDKNLKKINWNRVFSKAVTYLPILKVFDSEMLPENEKQFSKLSGQGRDFGNMSGSLRIIFGELHDFRNDYSHYYSTITGTVRKTAISKELAGFLKQNFKRAIEYTKKRFAGVYSESDFYLASQKQMVYDNTITTEGLVFLTCLFLEREYAFQFIGKVKGLKGTQYKSFTAFREVLMTFCVKLPHNKFRSDDFLQSFSLDIISELNRCPSILYNVITEEDRKKFRPEITNVAAKNLIDNSTGELAIDEDDYEEYIETLTKRVRHENRFSYFALRYIDEKNILGKFRFQINLGKLIMSEYKKPFDNEMVDRRIVETARIFGKLSSCVNENELLRKIDIQNLNTSFDQFAPHYNTTNNKIGILAKEDYSRLRNVANKSGTQKPNLFHPLPDAFISISELWKIILLDYLQPGEAEKAINDFILLNNSKLHNMDFISEIKKLLPPWPVFMKKVDTKKNKAYKKTELENLENRKKILNKVIGKYKLNDRQVPSKILEYWLNISDVKKEITIAERIKLMKNECRKRLRVVKKFRENGKGKIPKIGEMATFLAKDIVDMVIGESKKNKITSFYYDKMQECLALYADPEKKRQFIQIITNELGLFQPDGHPFLQKVEFAKYRDTLDIYLNYLMEKGEKMVEITKYDGRKSLKDVSWLRQTFYVQVEKEIKGIKKRLTDVVIPAHKSRIPFSIRQLEIKQPVTIEKWISNVSKWGKAGCETKPVNLPTNFFDQMIIKLLACEMKARNVALHGNEQVNQLLKTWWEKCRGDGIQDFYNEKREYVVFDETIRFIPGSKEKYEDYYHAALLKIHRTKVAKAKTEKKPEPTMEQVQKTFIKAIKDTEIEIRKIAEEDRICLLMLEKLLDGKQNNLDIRLRDIEKLLADTTTIKQSITNRLWFDSEGNVIKNKSNPVISRTIVAQRKGKNFGLLRKFVFDRRLPELFEYFNNQEIELDTLKKELDAYNKAKLTVFDMVFRLEAEIIQRNEARITQLFTDSNGIQQSGNIQHNPYLNWLLEKGKITPDEYRFLKMVRNCFSHNQFPQRESMNLFIPEWNCNFALTIAEMYNQKIDDLIDVL